MLPDSLEWVLEMLGFQWPTADEDKLFECAAAWRQFAADVEQIQVAGVTSAGNVLSENYGESIEGFSTTWQKFSGGSGYLDDARTAAESIAFTLEAVATLVIGMKLAVIAQLIILACEIIAAQAAAPFTLGLSELGALGATAATRMIVRQIIKECAQQLLQAALETAKEPAISALQAMISDVIAQTVNQNFGAQSGYDLGRTAKEGKDAGVDALKNSGQTFGEALRDGAGSRAGRGVRDGMDSAAGRSPDGDGDGGGSNSSSTSRSSSADPSSSGSSDSSSGPSGSSSSDGTGASNGSGTGANSPTGSSGGQGSTSSGSRAADGDAATGASASAGDGPTSSPWADPSQRPTDTTGQDYTPSPFDAPPSPRQDSGDASPASDTTSPDGGERRSMPGENIPGGSDPSRADSDAHRSTVGDGAAPPQSDGPATGQNTPGDQTPPRSDASRVAEPSPSNDPSPSTDRSSGPEPRTAPEPHRVDSPPASENAQVAPDRSDPAPTTPDPSPSSAPGPVSPADTAPAADTRSSTPAAPGPIPDPAQSRDENSSQTGGSRPSVPNATMPHGGPDRTHAGSYSPQPGPAHTAGPENDGMALQGSATATAPPPTTTPPADTGPTQHNPAPGTPQNTAPATTPPAPGPVPHQTPQASRPGPTNRPTTPRADRPAPPGDGNITDVSRQEPTTRPYDPRLDGPRRDETGTQTPGRIPPQRDDQGRSRPDADPRNPDNTAGRNRTHADAPQQDQRPGTQPDNNPQSAPDGQTAPKQGDPTPDETSPTPEQSQDPQPDNRPEQNADQPRPENLRTIRDELNTRPGGLLPPAPHDQQSLEASLPRNADGTPQRFADPFGPWNQLQNDGGFEMPGRSNNCADCSRSFLETWYGNPQVSAPRTPDTSPDGTLDRMSPENDSFNNMARWAGAPNTWAGNDHPNPYNRVAWDLYQAGHGAAAVVGVTWPGGGGHAFNAVNHHGRIIWIDTQSGKVSDKPIHLNADGVFYIPFDADRKPLQPWPSTEQSPQQGDSTTPDGSSQPRDGAETAESEADNGKPDGASAATDPHRATPADEDASSSRATDGVPTDTAADGPSDSAAPQPPGDPAPQPQDVLPDDGAHTVDQETADAPAESPENSGKDGAEGAEAGRPDPDGLHAIRDDLNTQPGGLLEPDAGDQQALLDSMPRNADGTPQRFPDPFLPWSGLQNDGGTAVSGRSNNCADCSRSFLQTWYGDPQVSAPRTPDTDENGKPDRWSPENDANDNQIRWSRARHSYAGTGDDPDTAARIAYDLQQAGHGAAAIVQVDWKGGGAHAFNAVNHHGRIVWIDTQSGQVSTTPLHIPQAKHAWYIPLDANRQPLHTDQAVAKPDTAANDSSQTAGPTPEVDHASETDHTPEASQPTENQPTTSSQDGPAGPDQKPGTGARESVPGRRDANASTYLANALRGEAFVYGGSPGDTRTGAHAAPGGTNTSSDSPQGHGNRAPADTPAAPPERTTAAGASGRPDLGRVPAEPGTGPDDTSSADHVRQRRERQLARANSDKEWFRTYYKENGHRRRIETRDKNGDRLPQLHPTGDRQTPWMLASDVPDADPATYIDSGAGNGGRDDPKLSAGDRASLDEVAKRRHRAIEADREPHKARQAAKETYEKDGTPENKKSFDDADKKHSPLHGAMTRASEEYGDKVAEHHAIPKHFPGATRIDDRGTGNNRFDQIWIRPGEPPEFVVVEAKGSTDAGLGQRRGLPEGAEAGDATRDGGDETTTAPRPAVPMVAQGTRPYFKAILHEMIERGKSGVKKAESDAEAQRAEAELELAEELRKALKERRVTYVVIKAKPDGEQHGGYEMGQFDIRTEKEKQDDQRSTS